MRHHVIEELETRRLCAIAPTDYVTSWVGNSFGGANRQYVQNYVDELDVSPDGTIYTNSHWDEDGKAGGVYDTNGNPSPTEFWDLGEEVINSYGTAGRAVAVDAGNVYFGNVGGGLLKYDRASKRLITKQSNVGSIIAMDVRNGVLYALQESGKIELRRASDLRVATSFPVPGARDVAVANDGNLWLLYDREVRQYTSSGVPMGGRIYGLTDPWAINIDAQNRLLVSENGLRRQVLFYSTTSSPVLLKTLGDLGGIMSGVPGVNSPTKFYQIVGADGDSVGNVYVALSGRDPSAGVTLRKFAPSGQLLWERFGHGFVDNVVVDPASDGADVYGTNEHYKLDLSKTVEGSEQSYYGYTFDPLLGPSGRGYTPAFAQRVQGKLLIFMTGQYSQPLEVYTPTRGEIMDLVYTYNRKLTNIPGGESFGAYVDTAGTIWEIAGSQIRRTPLVSFNGNTPVYGSSQSLSVPTSFTDGERLMYDVQSDVMFISGDTTRLSTPQGWGLTGRELARYDRWSTGNRTPTWRIDLPYDYSANPIVQTTSLAEAGDYIFSVGVQTRGKVWVWRKSDGSLVGNLVPEASVGGVDATGWVDLRYGLTAFKRSTGEYFVFVEEDARGKTLMYRWTPAASQGLAAVNGVPFTSVFSATAVSAVKPPGDSVRSAVIDLKSNPRVLSSAGPVLGNL